MSEHEQIQLLSNFGFFAVKDRIFGRNRTGTSTRAVDNNAEASTIFQWLTAAVDVRADVQPGFSSGFSDGIQRHPLRSGIADIYKQDLDELNLTYSHVSQVISIPTCARNS